MKIEVSLNINPEAIEFLESLSLADFLMENENPSFWSDDEFECVFMCLLKRHRINLVEWQIVSAEREESKNERS